MIKGRIKCVVWDLDNTLWNGILLEDPITTVNLATVAEIHRLDTLGILHSIASRSDHDLAMDRLNDLGLTEMFLYPQINWGPKSESVRRIAKALNIGLNTIAFIDDDPFERAEVAAALPEVTVIDVAEIANALHTVAFEPRFLTDEARNRRALYRAAARRDQEELDYSGPNDEFLAGLNMTFTISPATQHDLQRAEELTQRTNQLNATGVTYSYDELDAYRRSDDHHLLVTSLHDRFGSYGTIGIALLQLDELDWRLRMLLMSCRVASRGVGSVLLHHLMAQARDAGVGLLADFRETGRNLLMRATFTMAGFTEVERTGPPDSALIVLRSDPKWVQQPPSYLTVNAA